MGNEYDAVIADLEAQIAEFQMTVAVLRKRAGMSPDGGGGPSGREIHSAVPLQRVAGLEPTPRRASQPPKSG